MTLERSLLSVPASNPRMIEKAVASAADVVLIDIPDKEGMAKGKALDLMEEAPLIGHDRNLVGLLSHMRK